MNWHTLCSGTTWQQVIAFQRSDAVLASQHIRTSGPSTFRKKEAAADKKAVILLRARPDAQKAGPLSGLFLKALQSGLRSSARLLTPQLGKHASPKMAP